MKSLFGLALTENRNKKECIILKSIIMKKHLTLFTVLIFMVICYPSCEQQQIIDEMGQELISLEGNQIYNFRYKGISYAAEYKVIDSIMDFVDPLIEELICTLESNPTTATITHPNGTVEYFDTTEEMEEYIQNGFLFTNYIDTRSLTYKSIKSTTLKVYKDADFKGTVLTYHGPIEIPNMKNAYNVTPGVQALTDFNDQISSFQLDASVVTSTIAPPNPMYKYAIVTFYEDYDYKAGSATFIIDCDNPHISHNNFRKVKRCSTCKYNMNDRTSSIRLYYTNIK